MKNKCIFILILVGASWFWACKEENLALSDVIHFSDVTEESVAADNFSTLKITAVIPHDASPNNRSIKFKTDLGKFSDETTEIDETADSSGAATVYFHSDKPGKATITATVSTFSVTKTVNCTMVDISSLIRFEPQSTDLVVADNITSRTVNITINKNTPVDKRQITVTTDLGSFTNGDKTITLLAGGDGTASTEIKSDVPGTASLGASCNSFSTTTKVKFSAPDPDNIVRFDDGLLANVPADGVSSIEVRAVINNNTPIALRKVSFATDLGNFTSGQTQDVVPDGSGIARATLKSATEGTASVSLTHRNVTRTKTFTFTRAYPESLSISSDFTIKTGIANKVTIRVQLMRAVGKSSPNFAIDYTAVDKNNNSIGLFKNATLTDANGAASVEFSAGDGAALGVITIRARVREAQGATGETVITVVN